MADTLNRLQITRIEMAIEKMDDIVEDPNGTQELIGILETLGGVRVGRNWSRKTMGFGMKSSINNEIEKDIVVKDLPGPHRRLLRKFTEQLVINRKERNLRELMISRGTSLIQHLLFVLKVRSTELCDDVVKKCIDIIFGNETTRQAIMTNSVSAYLVETIILVASEHRLSRIWEKFLKVQLREMWKHDIANFVVQRLIDAAQSEKLFAEICKELLPDLDVIFTLNRPGIGVCLAKACQRFKNLQHDFISALMKAFKCYEPRENQINLVSLMLFKTHHEALANRRRGGGSSYHHHHLDSRVNDRDRDVWLHGSLMLQYIFGFRDTYKITKSLLNLDIQELIVVCVDKSGSHVIDSFLQSDSVGPNHKQSFLKKMQGSYAILAKDRFGSRIVDYLMNSPDQDIKDMIMKDLSSSRSLQSTENGYYTSRKLGVQTYRSRPDDWRRAADSQLSGSRSSSKRPYRDDDHDDNYRRPSKRFNGSNSSGDRH